MPNSGFKHALRSRRMNTDEVLKLNPLLLLGELAGGQAG